MLQPYEVDQLRSTMAGPPSDFMPPAHLLNIWEAWRRIEVRQLFRLSLEALLYWTIATLEEKPKGTDALVDVFLGQVSPPPNYANAREWLSASLPSGTRSNGADETDRTGTERAVRSRSGPEHHQLRLHSAWLNRRPKKVISSGRTDYHCFGRGGKRQSEQKARSRISCVMYSSPGFWPSMSTGPLDAGWQMPVRKEKPCCD